jgi:lactate dehydrogenase-like 2-hydroxyacid dehydrogenase
VLLLPLTPATENTLNATTLAALPRGAVVLNPGRGGLIDDAALLALHRVRTLMLLDAIDALNQQRTFVDATQHCPSTTTILDGQHDNLIAFSNLFHQYSPAGLRGLLAPATRSS